ncbi:MAG: peptidoglycan D,D-transpeptidase FtsI family protein [Deltaproteobacteria bacterium]
MTAFLLFLFLILLARLAWIQLYRGEELTAEALTQRTRRIEIEEYPRGSILDRNGIPLTGAVLTTALYAIPEETIGGQMSPGPGSSTNSKTLDYMTRQITGCLNGENSYSIKRNLLQAMATGKPAVRIASDLKPDEIRNFKSCGLPGLLVAPEIKRYRKDGFAAHLLGYVDGGEPIKGLAGIEKCYDGLLGQEDGITRLVSVLDARGEAIRGLQMRMASNNQVPRGSVVLTIDKRVQQAVEDVMNSRVGKGAVVIMDVRSKQILAMASRPVYDPYNIETTIKNDQNGSLNNRCLMSYPPGSLFKLLVAAAALDEGIVRSNDRFVCTGEYRFNQEAVIPCWKKQGHGNIRFDEAFAQSCNSVFIQTGLRLGRERLIRYVRQMHLADEAIGGFTYGAAGTGVNIDGGEAALGNASIGQQGVMLSPVQLCSLVATIADHGVWGKPSVVAYTVDRQGVKKELSASELLQTMKPDTAREMQKLMAKAVNEGTGQNAATGQIAVAGKTGTGQTGNIGRDNKELLNTWFAGYFPANQPRWAMVVLVEEGRSGAEDAAPVFRDITDKLVKILPAGDK